MQSIHVGAAALNQTPLDWNGNRNRILAAIEEARERDISLLCLPELCISGYGCEDAFHAPATAVRSLEVLGEIVPHTAGIAVAIGLPVAYESALFNASAMVIDGAVAGIVCKQNLAGDGVHYEPRWFKPWPEKTTTTIELADRDVPIGDVIFELDGIRVGFEICEDAWAADRPGSNLSARGADVILNPSASHFSFGKQAVRERFVLDGSRAFGVTYVYSNLLGNEAGRIIYDGGNLIASSGDLLQRGRRFSFDDHVLTDARVDVDRQRSRRGQLASFTPDFDYESRGGGRAHARADFDPRTEATPASHAGDSSDTPGDATDDVDRSGDWESGDHRKEEEFTRAVALGLFDYLRKTELRGYVISLSGGADSSTTACLVRLMVELAVDDLGWTGFRRRLEHLDDVLDDVDSTDEAVGRLLTCAYQSTSNSSETTLEAARRLAEAIGATFYHLDVDNLVDGYRHLIEDAIDRPLDWDRDDIALQNIQARSRAPSIWMFANIQNKLLLATSNRSEAAVGYTTMDGDTAGGLSPIAGIDKPFIRRWLKWLETVGPDGGDSIPALSAVTGRAPTAELRPDEDDQTDEDDLMPYEVLDAIEREAVRDKKSPRDVLRMLRAEFDAYDNAQLVEWVDRFFTLWSRHQWKRERYAPSFHLDDRSLDPKSWCRFPILSAGYERELDELRDWLKQDD